MNRRFDPGAARMASLAASSAAVAAFAFAGAAARSARADLVAPRVDAVFYGQPVMYVTGSDFRQETSIVRVRMRTQTVGRTATLAPIENGGSYISLPATDAIFREPDQAELWAEIDSDGGTTTLESNHVQFTIGGFSPPPLSAKRSASGPVTLRWQYGRTDLENALDAGDYVTGYDVFRSVHGEARFEKPPSLPANGLRPIDESWVDESAEPRTSYDYRIRATFLDRGTGPTASSFSELTAAATPPSRRLPYEQGRFNLWGRPFQNHDATAAWTLFDLGGDPLAPQGSYTGYSEGGGFGLLGDVWLHGDFGQSGARRFTGTIGTLPPDDSMKIGSFVFEMDADPAVRYSWFTARFEYVDPATGRRIVRKARGEAAPFAGTNVFVDAHSRRDSFRPGDLVTFTVDVRDSGPQAAPTGALGLHLDVEGAEILGIEGLRNISSPTHEAGASGADAVLGPLGPFGGRDGALARLKVTAHVTAVEGGFVRCRATVSQGTAVQWRREPIPLPPPREVLAVPVRVR